MAPFDDRSAIGPRVLLERGGGFAWDPPPPPKVPLWSPAEGGPKDLKRKSSWHRKGQRTIWAVSLGGGGGSYGVGPVYYIKLGGVGGGGVGMAKGGTTQWYAIVPGYSKDRRHLFRSLEGCVCGGGVFSCHNLEIVYQTVPP